MSDLIHARLQRIVRIIFPDSQLIKSWPLKGGLSAQATVLEVNTRDGLSKKIIMRQPPDFILRSNPFHADYEFNLLHLLRAKGIPAQTPLYVDQSCEIWPSPFLIVDYIEGNPDFSPFSLLYTAKKMAETLANIHSTVLSSDEQKFLRSKAQILPKRRENLDTALREEDIRNILEPIWPLSSRNTSVLVHADFWPGNIIWDKNELVATIDWENSGICDPLFDLAIARLDILWLFGRESMEHFTSHYVRLRPIDIEYLPYWDIFAALRPASRLGIWASVYPSLGRGDITEETMRRDHQYFLSKAIECL